jgi:hypothetical protein
LLQLNVLAVFVDTVFDPVFDIERVVGVSCVVRGNWHDPCGQQGIVPVEGVVRADSMRIPLKSLEREARHGVTKVDR